MVVYTNLPALGVEAQIDSLSGPTKETLADGGADSAIKRVMKSGILKTSAR